MVVANYSIEAYVKWQVLSKRVMCIFYAAALFYFSDRDDLFLPTWQDAMATALGAANPNTVVVARCPGACHMPWAHNVSAVLFELMPGREWSLYRCVGARLACECVAETRILPASTIFGSNVPSGKLPVTFPKTPVSGTGFPTDTWLSPIGGGPVIPSQVRGSSSAEKSSIVPARSVFHRQYPGTERGRGFPEVDYAEELLMGYRWYDAQVK